MASFAGLWLNMHRFMPTTNAKQTSPWPADPHQEQHRHG